MIETAIVVGIIAWIAYLAGQKRTEDRETAARQAEYQHVRHDVRQTAELLARKNGHNLGSEEARHDHPGIYTRSCTNVGCAAGTLYTDGPARINGKPYGGRACTDPCPVAAAAPDE